MDDKIVTCSICGFSEKWGSSDFYHGSMWECEECGEIFCSKCSEAHQGVLAHNYMVREKDILCPKCLEARKS